jgi:hypothetical protein
MHCKHHFIAGIILWALLGATNALAQEDHQHRHHAGHDSSIASPFDSVKNDKSLHCQLKKHSHIGFCPHSETSKDQSNSPQISVDCGGKTSGALPNVQSFSTDFAEMNFILPTPHKPENKLVLSKLFPFQRYSDLLDPPPRVI